jgi:hypothetical protein
MRSCWHRKQRGDSEHAAVAGVFRVTTKGWVGALLLLLGISFFIPSAPFPPKARGRRGFVSQASTGFTSSAAGCGCFFGGISPYSMRSKSFTQVEKFVRVFKNSSEALRQPILCRIRALFTGPKFCAAVS